MLLATWNEVEYGLDICRATKGPYIKIYWESYNSENSLTVSLYNGVTHKCV
jgi:hypothetical protein